MPSETSAAEVGTEEFDAFSTYGVESGSSYEVGDEFNTDQNSEKGESPREDEKSEPKETVIKTKLQDEKQSGVEEQPQGKGMVEIPAEQLELFKEVKDGLQMLGKVENLDQASYKISEALMKRFSSVQQKVQEAEERLFFASPDGERVRTLLSRYPGIPKDIALQIVKDANENERVRMETNTGQRTFDDGGSRLTAKQERMLQGMGCSRKEFLEDFQQIKENGRWVSWMDNDKPEYVVPIPTKPRKAER